MRFCSFALILFAGLAGPSGWVSTAAEVSLVQSTNSWHMRKGRSAVPAGWKTASDSALDTSWAVARGGFGYSDSAGETAGCATLLTDMRNSYTSVAIRRSFEVTEVPAPDARLYLTLDWDDGFIAFLNGEFLVSHNVTGQPAEPAFDARASDTHESSRGDSNRNEPV
ncbi:MAG: hypothetical protein FJ405_16350, partial [Verrucomicrobia bacterium]|nr:hypothetical protein [Verrucomicrobiota bacterium]